MSKKPPTIAQLKKLHKDLQRFHDWYFGDDNSSSESSDARTTLFSIQNAIDYTPKQIEKDRIEDARQSFDHIPRNWVNSK